MVPFVRDRAYIPIEDPINPVRHRKAANVCSGVTSSNALIERKISLGRRKLTSTPYGAHLLPMPTLGVDFDFSQTKQRAMDLGATADQIPYIMANECRADHQGLARHEGRSDGRDLRQDRSSEPVSACQGRHAPGEGRQPFDPVVGQRAADERRCRADAAAAEEFAEQLQARALHLPTPGPIDTQGEGAASS
ncbi:hypothetical protein QA640_17990 [Bradyrhizobium sp. CB82]|uniref:hypothetical protein n=1 Tax=Bradyrhizobium sp. CB82 TaxID=3039159 RepID=UPI0024B0C110|nr:hypothetical protein [Bradyrhizobium sp. CB82]WFU44171.1 hypothetical protein QA640_17990 [Bradyrhizobium sp. CB82]